MLISYSLHWKTILFGVIVELESRCFEIQSLNLAVIILEPREFALMTMVLVLLS